MNGYRLHNMSVARTVCCKVMSISKMQYTKQDQFTTINSSVSLFRINYSEFHTQIPSHFPESALVFYF